MAKTAALFSLLAEQDEDAKLILSQLSKDQTLLNECWDYAMDLRDLTPKNQANHAAALQDQIPENLISLILQRDGSKLIEDFCQDHSLQSGMAALESLDLPGPDYQTEAQELLEPIIASAQNCEDAYEVQQLLWNEWDFRGNTEDYYAPENSFLSQVLKSRRGLPITLTAIWMMVCDACDIEAQAVCLPGHVYGKSAGRYANIFTGKGPLELSSLLQNVGTIQRTELQALISSASTPALLSRMARNLANSYQQNKDFDRMHLAVEMSQLEVISQNE